MEEHVKPNAATVASIFFLFIRVALACRDKASVGGNSRTPSAPCEKTAYRYMAYTGRIERLSRVNVSAEQRREERYRRFHVLLPPGYYVSFPSNVRRSIEAKPNVRASSRQKLKSPSFSTNSSGRYSLGQDSVPRREDVSRFRAIGRHSRVADETTTKQTERTDRSR